MESVRRPTEVDTGWRERASGKRRKTEIDPDWRNKARAGLSVAEKKENYFRKLEDFQNETEKIPEFISVSNNIYKNKKTLSRAGGESIVLLCSDPDENDVVIKAYYEPVNSEESMLSSRSFVFEYMETEDGKRYALPITEVGFFTFEDSKYFFEVMPFCKEGDLAEAGKISFDELVEIIRQVNEAIHNVHIHGLLHMDIKPENVYRMADRLVLGDFGVAKFIGNKQARVTGHIRVTEGYAAPELRLALTNDVAFLCNEKCDYYSFGVTIASLFEGRYIYEELKPEMVLSAVLHGHIPFTRDDEGKDLILNLAKGLCRYDPSERFGYEDVCKWLDNPEYTGDFAVNAADDGKWSKKFVFEEKVVCTDAESLFKAITANNDSWSYGLKYLYGKHISNFFSSFIPNLALFADDCEEKYRATGRDKGLSVFLKKLYPAGPIVWRGFTSTGLKDLAERILAANSINGFTDMLCNNVVSHWLRNTQGITVDSETLELVDEIEVLALKEPYVACYWFAYSFAENKTIEVCGQTADSVDGLMKALFSDPAVFYDAGYPILMNKTIGAKMYGFLYSFGYRQITDKVWNGLAENITLTNKLTMLMSLLDEIAVYEKLNPAVIRTFFINYGPAGPATFVKKLVDEGLTYVALDAEGKRLIENIGSFQTPSLSNSVREINNAELRLFAAVEKLKGALVDNPFLVKAGVFEDSGVICKNLAGVFAFEFLKADAPLGFAALIGHK